jgi:hypothetical protein
MAGPATIQTEDSQHNDPIWQWVRVERVRKSLWLVCTIAYLILILINQQWSQLLFLEIVALFNMVIAITVIADDFKQRRYWRQIGEQRRMALHDPAHFHAHMQPSQHTELSQLPITIQLKHKQIWIRAIAVLWLILFIISLVSGVYLLTHASQSNAEVMPWLITCALGSSFCVAILIVGALSYFLYFRYQAQSIEINAEGITTRFKRQERSIRWDEARVFAHYSITSWNTQPHRDRDIFELSNEQTIVRWGKQGKYANFLKFISNIPGADDFDWLLEQINALVTERTGLSLLHFEEQKQAKAKIIQQRPQSQSQGTTEQETQAVQMVQRLALEDPLRRLISWNKRQIISLALLFIFALACIVAGIRPMTEPNNQHQMASILIQAAGILLLLLVGITVGIKIVARNFLLPLWQRREQAVREPERWLAQEQPQPDKELPQPRRLSIEVRRSFTFWIGTLTGFVIYSFLGEIIFHQTGIMLVVIPGVSLLLALLTAAFLLTTQSNTNPQRIEVSENGLMARLALSENHLNWQDVRFFTRYQGFRLRKAGKAQIDIYELVGKHSIVRWQWDHKRRFSSKTVPLTSQSEIDHWMEQLQSYIVERTGLPLLDLDRHQ